MGKHTRASLESEQRAFMGVILAIWEYLGEILALTALGGLSIVLWVAYIRHIGESGKDRRN